MTSNKVFDTPTPRAKMVFLLPPLNIFTSPLLAQRKIFQKQIQINGTPLFIVAVAMFMQTGPKMFVCALNSAFCFTFYINSRQPKNANSPPYLIAVSNP